MKKSKFKYLTALLCSTLMLLGFASVAMASGGGDMPLSPPAGIPPAFPNFYTIGWTMVDFLFLLALLYKFAFNPINDILDKRSQTISTALAHAEEVKAEVQALHEKAQKDLQGARQEAQNIINNALKVAEENKNDIINKANEEVNHMKEKARNELLSATEQAKAQLREEAANLAILAAEKVLNRNLTAEDDKQMIKEFVDQSGEYLC